MAKYSDNTSSDMTTQVVWSQNPALGTISGTTFTGTHVGKTTLKATLSGVSSNNLGIEIQKQLTTLRVSGTVDNTKRVAQLKATAVYSDNSQSDVTSSTKWTINSPANSGATISSSGLLSLGPNSPTTTYTVSGSYGGKSATTSLSFYPILY